MPLAKLDAKFYGEIRKIKDDALLQEDEYMVFLAKDNAFPATLEFYLSKCMQLGADAEHIAAVERTLARLYIWRENNQHRLKVPDAKGEKLAG